MSVALEPYQFSVYQLASLSYSKELMLPGTSTQSMNTITAERFLQEFAAEVRALFEIGESLGNSQFSVTYDPFAERIYRTVQKELLARGEAEPDDHDSIAEFIARLKADDLYLAI